jgi:hypothetical protein
MPFIICKDCNLPARVSKLKNGDNQYYTKALADGCQCGTDQRRGEPRQQWLRENMVETIEELNHSTDDFSIPKPVKNATSQHAGAENDIPDIPLIPKSKKKKSSKLWWLLVPVAGLGILAAKTLSRGKSQ